MNTLRYIEWNDRYLTGVAECDADHQRIIGIVNELYAAIQEGQRNDVLEGVLRELGRYTEEHFAREDTYLDALEPVEAAAHRQRHAEMASWTRGISAGWAHERADISREVLDRLKRWWTGHILAADQAYAPALSTTTTDGAGEKA